MRLLALDIGFGTQDILILDTAQPVENALQLILPAPTQIVAQKIHQATAARRPILLHGVTMGGNANMRALLDHLAQGLKAYATPEAARTFNDDLDIVAGWGVGLVSEDEAKKLRGVARIETKDLDLAAIGRALAAFGVADNYDGVAVAVLDHGAAPSGTSDRLFRFQHLQRVVEQGGGLLAFAYLSEEIPEYLTRMKAVAASLERSVPLLLLDTGVAAALGSLEDREVAHHRHHLLVNLGNSHTLAFHLAEHAILGLLEHHTSLLTRPKLEGLLEKLVQGQLSFQEVFEDDGHGSFVKSGSRRWPFLSVTGPRRRLMKNSLLRPYLAAPHGNMMLTGCFGLVRAFAYKTPAWREEIEQALTRG